MHARCIFVIYADVTDMSIAILEKRLSDRESASPGQPESQHATQPGPVVTVHGHTDTASLGYLDSTGSLGNFDTSHTGLCTPTGDTDTYPAQIPDNAFYSDIALFAAQQHIEPCPQQLPSPGDTSVIFPNDFLQKGSLFSTGSTPVLSLHGPPPDVPICELMRADL